MKRYFIVLALVVFLFGLMTPALGINMNFNTGNGGKVISSCSTYNLDKSTSLQESVTMGDGKISKDLTANGSGNNHISVSSSADDKSAGIEIESSGIFQTAAFGGVSDDGVLISQHTAMSGSYGGIASHADSPGNKMAISSGFEGEGDLTTGTSAAAGKNAAISGNVIAQGIELFDTDSMQALASGDIAISMEGLYALPNGDLGNFGLSASNTDKRTISSETSATLTGPTYTEDGGRQEAYALLGYRWNTKDPQLKWVLKNDAYMIGEGLGASSVQSAIAAAANTWDDATNQNLFADSNMVILDPNAVAEKYNKINTVSWRSFGASKCLAYATTFYSSSKMVGGYKTALDSDLVFNTDYQWRIDRPDIGFDVQTTALHEMGHTLGLADLYGKTQFKYDTRQVMHYYTTEKRALGNGDLTGIWNLYQ
jgi:hypothetical protein